MSIHKIQQFPWIPSFFFDEIKLLLYPRARISATHPTLSNIPTSKNQTLEPSDPAKLGVKNHASFWKNFKVKGKGNYCCFTGKRLWWKDFWLCRVTGQNHTNWLCFMQNWSVSILWKKRIHWNRTSSSRRIRWNERNYNEIWIENGYYAKKSKINFKKYCKKRLDKKYSQRLK